MRLALITGKQNGNIVKERLQGIKDNLNIEVFDEIPEYIDFTKKRNIVFDRVVIVSNLITPAALKDLYTYWNFTSKDTNIIVIGKKERDEKMAEAFNSRFQSPVTAFMLVGSTSVKLFAEAVLSKTPDLNEKYGIMKNDIQVEEEGVELDLGNDEKEEEKKEQKQPKKAQEQKKVKEKEKKDKKGLLGGLFGKKEKSKEEQKPATPQINMADAMQSLIDEELNQSQQEPQQTMQNTQQNIQKSQQTRTAQTVQKEQKVENQEINTLASNVDDVGNLNQSFAEAGHTTILKQPNNGDNMFNTSGIINQLDGDEEDIHEFADQNDVTDIDFGAMHTVTEDLPQEEPIAEDTTEPEETFEEVKFPEEPKWNEQKEPQESINTVKKEVNAMGTDDNDVVDTDFDMNLNDTFDYQGIEEFGETQNNTQLQVVNNDAQVDDDLDFGSQTVKTETRSSRNMPTQNVDIREVDDNLGDLGASTAEQAYRQQQEAQRVVVKEVVKEVKVSTGHGTINALKGVVSGRTHKVLIVTGDRATGITTTALNIAQELSKQVPILYFDCDVRNHGLLSYINYDNFRDYENVHMQGVKLAKNAKAFKSCVCKYADNFDILTTDYSCDVTDEELETASMTVAEIAGDYGVVVVDCPVEKIHLLQDLVMVGNTVLCVEGSKRGFMNMLSELENSPLSVRYKRAMVSKGTMFVTKASKNTNMKQLKAYISDIFVPTGADWMSMQATVFNGKLNEALLNTVLE